MRICADRDSPYYDADKVRRAVVACDGFIVHQCVEADEEEGWAEFFVGRYALNGGRTERISGKVEIRLTPAVLGK